MGVGERGEVVRGDGRGHKSRMEARMRCQIGSLMAKTLVEWRVMTNADARDVMAAPVCGNQRGEKARMRHGRSC